MATYPHIVGEQERPASVHAEMTILGAMLAELEQCISVARPLSVSGGTYHLGMPVLFRALLLPLSSDGSHIDSILGAANSRHMLRNEKIGLHKIRVE